MTSTTHNHTGKATNLTNAPKFTHQIDGFLMAAFQANNGKTYYVGYQKSKLSFDDFESFWQCNFFGTLEEVMSAIESGAEHCASGFYTGREGAHMAPEQYVENWMRELANPVVLEDQSLVISGDFDFSFSWDSEPGEALTAALATVDEETSKTFISTFNQGNSTSLSLYADIELISALYGHGKVWNPSLIFSERSVQIDGARDAELGYVHQ